MPDIEACRKEIDEIESQLIKVLSRRAELAIEIGHFKRTQDLPIYDPVREQEIIDRIQRNNPGPLSNKAIKEIFEKIILETRTLEDEKNQ